LLCSGLLGLAWLEHCTETDVFPHSCDRLVGSVIEGWPPTCPCTKNHNNKSVFCLISRERFLISTRTQLEIIVPEYWCTDLTLTQRMPMSIHATNTQPQNIVQLSALRASTGCRCDRCKKTMCNSRLFSHK
jgi:hypothetical protein